MQPRRLPFSYYHPELRDGVKVLVDAGFSPDSVAECATALARDMADQDKRTDRQGDAG